MNSRRRSVSTQCVGTKRASGLDDEMAVHAFVSVAAEYIAQEVEATGLVRRERHLGHLARHDQRAQPELGREEAHRHLGRGELQHHRLALLDRDLVGNEHELARDHREAPRAALGRGARGHRHQRGGEASQENTSIHVQTPVMPGWSSAYVATSWRSTSRKPSPRNGCAASHLIGSRLGCDPGAGSGKISEGAAWCAMWPVSWWCSWWMWP